MRITEASARTLLRALPPLALLALSDCMPPQRAMMNPWGAPASIEAPPRAPASTFEGTEDGAAYASLWLRASHLGPIDQAALEQRPALQACRGSAPLTLRVTAAPDGVVEHVRLAPNATAEQVHCVRFALVGQRVLTPTRQREVYYGRLGATATPDVAYDAVAATRTVTAHAGELRDCGIHGARTVPLRVVITPEGEALHASAEPVRDDPEAARCVALHALSWRFEAPAGGAFAVLETPVSVEAPALPPPPAMGSAPAVPALPVTRFTLENGLDVVAVPLATTARVAVVVQYRVGAVDDPRGYHGLAHTTEHLTFHGTRHSGGDLGEALDAAGVTRSNGVTSERATTYYETADGAALDRLLWVEAERMGWALDRVDNAGVGRERPVLREEHTQRFVAAPLGAFREIFARAVYPEGHPMHDAWERLEDYDRLDAAHVQWFFQTWYAPDNARLVVVGAVDAATLRARVERYFATIPRGGARPAHATRVPMRVTARPVRIESSAGGDQVSMYWNAPAVLTPDDLALDLVADALAKRLHDDLVDRGLALEVEAHEESRPAHSVFSLSALCAAGVSSEQLAAEMERSLAQGVSAFDGATFEAARRRRQFHMTGLLEDPLALAMMVAEHADAEDPGALRRWVDGYAALDLATVRAAFARWIAGARPQVFLVRASPYAPPAGRRVGKGL